MDAAGDQGFGDLLVVGTQGTLEPYAAVHGLRDGERLAEEIPPFAEELLRPWLKRALREVTALRMPAASAIAGEPVPLDGLLEALKQRLSELLSPALSEWAGRVDAAAFWRKVPALRWLVGRTVRDWVEGTALFLGRLDGDRGLLAGCLGVGKLGSVASLEAAASDLHPGGAMVLKVGFVGGGWVFYKPRPVTGEWLWWALLEAVSGGVPLPAGRVVFGGRTDGDAYGWMESVREEEGWPGRRDAGNAGAGWSYWERAGAVICLAQHMRLTDLHMGNVLATPYGPAVTDAECLGTSVSLGEGFAGAVEGLRDTGLLPQRRGGGVDASGLFGRAGAVPGLRLGCWAVSQAGDWRFTALPAALVRHGNLPKEDAAVSPMAVAAEVCSGYRRGAEVLMEARETLLAAGSAWRETLETRHAPRCVLRETVVYGKVLSRSLAAASLRDQGLRRRTLAEWMGSAALPERVVEAEVRALMAGSVPRLAISAGSRTLCDSDGRVLQQDFSECTPGESVVRNLESLTTARLEQTLLPALLATLL